MLIYSGINRLPAISIEEDLSLQLLQPELDNDKINFLLKKVNWSYFLNIVNQHGIIPIVYKALIRDVSYIIPALVIKEIKKLHHTNVLRNILLKAEMKRIYEIFSKANIPHMFIKGPILAQSLFGDSSCRQSIDIDVIVYDASVEKVTYLLKTYRYEPKWQPKHCIKDYVNFYHGLVFISPHNNVNVDLQWNIGSPNFIFPIKLADLLKDAEVATLDGNIFRCPSPDHNLILMCCHGTVHCWCKLKWICDISTFMSIYNKEINWKQTLENAAKYGIERIILLGLKITQDLLGTDIPKLVREKLKSEMVVANLSKNIIMKLFWNSNDIPKGIFDAHPGVYGSFGFFERHIFYIKARGGIREKVHLCNYVLKTIAKRVFIPNNVDKELIILPSPIRFLYYLLRPIRLSIKYGQRLGSHINSIIWPAKRFK